MIEIPRGFQLDVTADYDTETDSFRYTISVRKGYVGYTVPKVEGRANHLAAFRERILCSLELFGVRREDVRINEKALLNMEYGDE